MKPSKKFDAIKFSSVIRIADTVRELERAGKKIIRLETGEPHVASPNAAIAAAEEALRSEKTHYGHSRGLPELRACVCEHHARVYGVSLDPNKHILITPGGKQALWYALASLVDDGDEILIGQPGWVTYDEIVKLVGGIPIPAPMDPAADFSLKAQPYLNAITSRTRAIVLNTPSNPTGRMISHSELEKLAAVCRERDIMLISDEIYDQIRFTDTPHVSALTYDQKLEHTILINGFSKTYAMTGWRLGYVLADQLFIDTMLKLQQNSITCPTVFAQYGALAALTAGASFVDATVRLYHDNRDFLLAEMSKVAAVRCIEPQGGLYAFIDVSRINPDSVSFAEDFLSQQYVSVVPGSAFGASGEGFIRICLATDKRNITEFVSRLRSYVTSKVASASKMR